MDHPKTIEKRILTCTSCGYSAQVYGEQYYDYGCCDYIITFTCLECKILFENIITKKECWKIPVVKYVLAEDVVCMWCGKNKIKVWNKETGRCPKCASEMICQTDGEIKVEYTPNPT